MRISPAMVKGPSPETDASWKRFLDPQELKSNLIVASIYIAGFETLKSVIIGRIKDFFWSGFDQTGDIIDESYKTKVLALDPKGNTYKASLAWLKQMSVIDDFDLAKLQAISDTRNEMAHDLVSVTANGVPVQCKERLTDMIRLLHKIEVWWIRNVEMETDPEFADPDAKDEDIHPGTVITLQLMTHIALSPEQESRFYYDEFLKRFAPPPVSEKKYAGP